MMSPQRPKNGHARNKNPVCESEHCEIRSAWIVNGESFYCKHHFAEIAIEMAPWEDAELIQQAGEMEFEYDVSNQDAEICRSCNPERYEREYG